jgi:hypothetical protein
MKTFVSSYRPPYIKSPLMIAYESKYVGVFNNYKCHRMVVFSASVRGYYSA